MGGKYLCLDLSYHFAGPSLIKCVPFVPACLPTISGVWSDLQQLQLHFPCTYTYTRVQRDTEQQIKRCNGEMTGSSCSIFLSYI